MTIGWLTLLLATTAVARATIILGGLGYRGKWLNYPIALAGGFLGSELLVLQTPFAEPVLGAAMATCFYQMLRQIGLRPRRRQTAIAHWQLSQMQ